MRRAISIAGVRPLDWIARASAPSAVAWHCPAQSRGAARGARCGDGATRACATWRWAWERAMIMRVSAQGQAYGYLCAREQLDESPCCTSPKRESSASGVVTRVIAAEHGRIQVFVRFWRIVMRSSSSSSKWRSPIRLLYAHRWRERSGGQISAQPSPLDSRYRIGVFLIQEKVNL